MLTYFSMSGADKDYIPMFSWTNLFLAVLRPVLYVEFRARRMQFKQQIMKLNEVHHLIIYCLNCIRRNQNSTYQTGLRLNNKVIFNPTKHET